MQKDQLILIDELTGLFNRRYLRMRLQEEVERARRMSLPLSLMIVDIDHFKWVNDTYGHLSGDSVLKQAALALSRVVRKVDVLCRYGGDEFVIILPRTGENGVKKVANRISDIFSKAVFWIGSRSIRLSVSIGISTTSSEDADTERLFKEADKALYQAKESGRKKFVHFADTDASLKVPKEPDWNVFVGREREIKSIVKRILKVRSGDGGMLILRGNKGIGKTSLARRVEEEAAQRMFLTTFVSLESSPGKSPFQPFLEPLTYFFSSEVEKKVPAVGRLLAFSDFKKEKFSHTPINREDLFGSLMGYYRALSSLRPLFIVWDNVEFLSDVARDFLPRFLRQIEELPILILATHDVDREDALATRNFLLTLANVHHNLSFMELQPFDEEITRIYITSALRDMRFSKDILELVFSKGRGNPLFTREVLRALFNTGGLRFDEKHGWSVINKKVKLPSSIKDVLESNLLNVGEEERKVLEIAAILGESLPFPLLLNVSRMNEGQLVDILDSLISREFLEEDGDILRFQQPLLIELLEEKMSSFRKHYIHKRAAEVLESEFLRGNAGAARDVSKHYLHAGEKEKALEYLLKAAKHAKDESRMEEALFLYEQALSIISDPIKKTDIDIERAKLLRSVGASKEAGALIKKVLKRGSLTPCQRLDALYTLAISYEGVSDFSNALKALDIVENDWKRNKSKLKECNKWVDAIKMRAWIYFIQGEYQLSQEYLLKGLRTLARTSKIEDRELKIASFYNILGAVHGHLGDYSKAKKFYLKALETFKKQKKWKDAAVIYNNITAIYSQQGDYIKAIESLESAMEIDEKYGDKLALAIVFYNLGEIYHSMNILDVALSYYERYVELNKEIENRLGFGYGNLGMGRLKMQRRDFAEAEEYLEKAKRIFKRLGSRAMALYAEITQLELAIKKGDLEKALELEKRLEKAIRGAPDFPWRESFYIQQAKLFYLSGRLSDIDIERLKLVANAAKISPGDISLVEAYSLIVNVLRSRGELEEARAYLKEGLSQLSRIVRGIPRGFMREMLLEKDEIQSLLALKKSFQAVKV